MNSTESTSWIPPEHSGHLQHNRPAMTSGAPGPRRALLPDQSRSGGSSHTLTTYRQPGHVLEPQPSKRICFYKSGDPQFGGLRMVVNRRTFKSFEALLDSLSTKVPLPFGVRNITTPRGIHTVHTLDQLEDGKSYICSDSRKVKPINLALARKKLPPWYSARPGTGRRRAVQGARMYPGGGKLRRAMPVVVRTPRRLTVFRNGEFAISQTVMLKKKSTQSFDVLLEDLSELMQFPVVKLHTADGRRVDGLPALILCSGMIVVAGKEPFKPGNYDIQRSPAPKWPPTNRLGSRKFRPSKKMSRNYSDSSRRYVLNQIHNSISESMCDYPSNPTDSIELDNSHMLESVIETDAEPCPDHGTHEQGSCLPTEDDIEKSFRVNQDGSMTVEMKVRLTLKEEETIHWTTTVTRSSVANQLLPDSFPEPEPEAGSELEHETSSPEPNRPELSHPVVPLETTSSHKPRGNGDNKPRPLEREVGNMEEEVTGKTSNVMSPWRAPTPGIRKAQTVTESMRANTSETVQEGTVRSYSYRAETEQYHVVQQSSTRPVPKPRRLPSMDVNYRYDQAEFNSVGMSEVLQIENNGEEVTETVLHIYEQQTCQENFYANTHYRAQGTSVYSACYGRPSTSDTAWSMNACVEPQSGRPSTASAFIHTMRDDSMLLSSEITPCKGLVRNAQNKVSATSKDSSQLPRESGKGKDHQNVVDKANKTSLNTKAKKHVRWINSPGNRRKQSPPEASKKRAKLKPFSSIGFLKQIYGGRPRPGKNMMRRKTSTEKEKKRLATERSVPQDATLKRTIKDPNTQSSGDDKKQETSMFETNMLKLSSKTQGTLTHQKSIHEDRQAHKASSEVNKTMPLSLFNSSSSVSNDYVEHWLENSPSQHAFCPSDQTQVVKINQVGLEGWIPEESRIHSLTNKDKTEKSDMKQKPKNTSVPSNAMLTTLSPTSSRTLADRPLSVRPKSDQAPSPTDHPKATSISNLSAECEEPLSRKSSVKRARLVSNLSFERKMSQRKASLEKSALTMDDPLQTTTSSIPIQMADGDTLELCSVMSMKKKEPTAILLEMPPHMDCNSDQTSMAGRSSYCTSVSPVSTSSDKGVYSPSPASSDASYVDSTQTIHLSSTQTDTVLPEPSTRVKDSDLPLQKKLSIRKSRHEASAISNEPPAEEIPVSNSPSLKRTQLPRNQSLKSASSHKPSMDSSKAKTLNSSPSSESPSLLHKTHSQKKTSPYSQSLDLAPSPGKQRTKKNLVHKNLSPDKRSEQTNPTPDELEIPQRNRLQNELSEESPVGLEPDKLDKMETGISATISNTGLNESEKETRPLELTDQPNLKPVLEKICFSIKSIRQITQNKRPSCLEKSNSLPDFSGHVATTFGSSSKALLAFLAVMTLKEDLTHERKHELDALNSSWAEALKLIDSLREIASIEDSDQLKTSLSELQKSASTQLLESWKDFQELSKSRRSPKQSEEELRSGRSSVEYCATEGGAIDVLMEELHIPETLKEELAAFPVCTPTEIDDSLSIKANAIEKPLNDNVTINCDTDTDTVTGSDCSQNGRANVGVEALVDVKAIVKRFSHHGKPQASHEKPVNLKQPNLSDDQKAVHTQKTHNAEDSTRDISAPQVSIDDNKEVDSRNDDKNQKVKEEVEQGSPNKEQSIQSDVPYMDLEDTTEERHEENRCSSEGEHLDRESKEHDRNSNDSMFSPDEVSSSDEEQKHILSSEGHQKNICNLKTQQKLSSPEEQQDVELRQLKQVRNNNMSDYKSLSSSEEEEHKLQHTNRFTRLSITISSTQEKSNQDIDDRTSSEDDQRVQQLSRTNIRSVHIFPPVDKQIWQKLTKIESLSERSEENVSTLDAEELINLEKDQPPIHKHEPQEQLSCTEAKTKPVCKAVNQEQYVHGKSSPEDTPRQKAQSAEIISQSVAERIGLLNKQVAETQWKSKTAGGSSVQILTEEAPSNIALYKPDTKTTRTLPGSRSAPQSSLSFSYDSCGIINRQPEGAMVRSIKDMFMAKSVPDVQGEDGDVHGPISPKPRPSSQSQAPLELSEARSIARGFVRKTIERLYGRKDPAAGDTPSKRPTSSPKQTRESLSIFSSLHSARPKQQSDMPYFNSTNTANALSGATRCMAFNTQVGPDDSRPVDLDRPLNHKSFSDPAQINKVVETPHLDEDLSEDTKQDPVPVSLFSANTEPEVKLAPTKCTYFSLPCTSDSEQGSEDLGAMSKNGESSVDIKEEKEEQEEAKGCVGRNSALPGLRLHDNKVHPVTQEVPGGQVVVVQPSRDQRVVHRPVELDALDALYTFCGQHCPIL